MVRPINLPRLDITRYPSPSLQERALYEARVPNETTWVRVGVAESPSSPRRGCGELGGRSLSLPPPRVRARKLPQVVLDHMRARDDHIGVDAGEGRYDGGEWRQKRARAPWIAPVDGTRGPCLYM